MITKIAQDENIFAYEVTDKVTEDEYQQVTGELREAIARHGKVRVLTRIPDSGMPGTEMSTIDDRLRFAKDHMSDIERVAVVGDSTAAEWLTRISDKVTSADMRPFNPDQEAEAWSWLHAN